MLEATNKQTPTGGVVRPIIRFNTAITAKWMGSTSTAKATFNRIGNKISSAAMVSIKVPTTISNRLMSSSTTYLLVVKPKISADMVCGICSVIKINPKRLAKPTKTISEAEVFILSKKMTCIFLKFKRRYTNLPIISV